MQKVSFWRRIELLLRAVTEDIKNPAKPDDLRGQAVVYVISIINSCSLAKQKQGAKQGALKHDFYFYYKKGCVTRPWLFHYCDA